MADSKERNENAFMLWLSDKVSPAQLSELYLAYNEIEEQAKKARLIRASLYENLDPLFIRKIQSEIEKSKIFKFTHKRQWGRILSALDYLHKYAAQKWAANKEELVTSTAIKQDVSAESTVIPKAEERTTSHQNEKERDGRLIEEADSGFAEIKMPENTIQFDSLETVAFTKPITLTYFGDTKPESSWKGVYVDACAMLFEDYPDIFKKLREESIFGEGKTWLVDSVHIDLLAVPKKVASDFFVETNRNASDLMKNLKWLLDRCSVDYENVVITYSKNMEPSAEPGNNMQSAKEDSQTHRYFRADKEAFYRWMMEDQHKAEATCRGYVSAIRTAERFAKEHGIGSGKLFTDNPEEAKDTAKDLFEHSGFVRFNADRHNQFSAAISMLLAFYSTKPRSSETNIPIATEKDSDSIEKQKTLHQAAGNEIDSFLGGEEFLPLRDALASQKITTIDDLRSLKLWSFMNRHNIYSIGMRQTIFAKVNALLHPTADLNDEQAYILQVGEKYYKGNTPSEAFCLFCDNMVSGYPLQLRLLIGMKTSFGAVPIYKDGSKTPSLKMNNIPAFINANLSAEEVIQYTKWVCSRCGEKNASIVISEPQHVSIPHSETASPKTDLRIERQVVSVFEPTQAMQQSQLQRISAYARKLEELTLARDMQGITYDEARDAMHVTMVATKQAAANAEHIVDIKGRLFHEDAFIDWEDGADQLEDIIDKLMQKNSGYIAAAQLYEYAKVEMNMFLTDNDLNDERSVYDIATHLFEKKGYHGKHYSFYGKMHISRKDHPVTSNLDIFRNFAADQGGIFSFDSLVEYLHSIGIGSGNLRMQMKIPDEPIFFYYENGILIYADNMRIDDTWISAVKKELAILLTDVGGHIILRAVPDIWLEQLPSLPAGKHWTPLLLQSVLRCYSKDLGAKTIQALSGQSLDTLHTMLVANDSPIQTFGDVVVSYLVENDIDKRSFEAETLRLLLVDAGIIQGNELIWNMPKALNNDERFAWDASGDHVIVEI